MHDHPPSGTRTTTAATIAVGLMAAALSYDHMRLLAVAVGEPPWRAAILPLTVDGLVIVATRVTLTRRGMGTPVGWLAYTALAASVLASLAANVVSGDPTLVPAHVVRWVVSAWPPLAVAMAFELVLQYRSQPAAVAAPEAGPAVPGEVHTVVSGRPVEATVLHLAEDQAREAARPVLVPAGALASDPVDEVFARHRDARTAPSRRQFQLEVKAAGGGIGTTRATELVNELRTLAEADAS